MTEAIDLLVIGGGINGAGIARDAAGRGLSVVLCERGDLAEATPSRSSKLIHGGLRYLEYDQFRLVCEALADLGRRFGLDFHESEARYLVAEEWVETADDILVRRTKHGLRMNANERSAFERWIATGGRP